MPFCPLKSMEAVSIRAHGKLHSHVASSELYAHTHCDPRIDSVRLGLENSVMDERVVARLRAPCISKCLKWTMVSLSVNTVDECSQA